MASEKFWYRVVAHYNSEAELKNIFFIIKAEDEEEAIRTLTVLLCCRSDGGM